MTEKKYMTASEYFIKTRINNQRWYDSDEANESTIKELDTQFINKDLLKDKIYNLNKTNYDEVCLNGNIVTSKVERILYNLEMFIYNNTNMQKKAFKDSKIIKEKIKENKKEILEMLK